MLDDSNKPITRPALAAINKNNSSLWSKYYSMGNSAHKQQQFTKAAAYFEKCIEICTEMLRQKLFKEGRLVKTLPEMLYQASHNLAACHNAMGRGLFAKNILTKLHNHFIHIAGCPNHTRSVRLDVLAHIDQSLFSLTSQLAYLNQVNEIHSIIVKTEDIVTVVSKHLLSNIDQTTPNSSDKLWGNRTAENFREGSRHLRASAFL
jgi:hypothetical protein